MNNWTAKCVQDVIAILQEIQRDDLASDLQRIGSAIGLDELEVMRSESADRLATEIAAADSVSQILRLLRKFTRTIGVQHCTLHLSDEVIPGTFSTRILTTYPDSWATRYLDRRYAFIDPVITACKIRTAPFYWDDLAALSATVKSFWRDADTYGVGSSGYSIPVALEYGDVISISMSSSLDAARFRDLIAPLESDLFVLGLHLAEAFDRILSARRPSVIHPTDDQMFILHAIAVGVEPDDIKDLPFQYGSYIALKRSICSLFQTRTLAQAAVIAARLGLLNSPPLSKSDILSEDDPPSDASQEGIEDGRQYPVWHCPSPFAAGQLNLPARNLSDGVS